MSIQQDLKIAGIWQELEDIWLKVSRTFKDREANEGRDFKREKLDLFRSLAQSRRSKEVVDLFLNEYGLLARTINRANHKKFNPDGSWISNGVRFGP